MIKIRLTLENGNRYYVSEGWPFSEKFFILKHNFGEGQSYHTPLEFRVAWEIYHNKHHYEFQGIKLENPDYNFLTESSYKKYFHIPPEKVVLIEAIDEHTLKKTKIKLDVSKNARMPKVLKFPEIQFDMLKHCRYASCHWTYINNKWIAFPTNEQYNKINRIEYYRRGLTAVIFDAFIYRNTRYDLMNDFYKNRRELLFNPIMQKMYLYNHIDSCKRFTILPIK